VFYIYMSALQTWVSSGRRKKPSREILAPVS
jgi:hypothetical protein